MIRKYFKLLLPQLFFNVYNRLPLFNFKRFWNKSKSNKYLDKKALEIERFSGDSVCLDYLLELTHSC